MEIRNQYSPISYQGINKSISKYVYNREGVLYFIHKYPKANGIAGKIPPEWVQNMQKENRAENIKEFYNTFGKFVSKFLPVFSDSKFSNFVLTKIMRKYGAIEKDASVRIEKLKSGSFGQGYKLVNEKDGSSLFIKRFVDKKKDMDGDIFDRHGIYAETNRKLYLKRHLKSKQEREQFSHFYYSDMKNDYYVERFIDKPDEMDTFSSMQKRDLVGKIHDTLHKQHLHHNDLTHWNVRFYIDEKKKPRAICFDVGGIENNY